MLLSKRSEYGLRAMLYLAGEVNREYVPIGDISDRLGISFAFLGKIFQTLNDAELTTSRRGPHGGVALSRSSASITMYDVVAALDGQDVFRECVLGLPGCGEQKPCPLHDSWARQRDQVELLFRRASLAQLAKDREAQGFRLAPCTGSVRGEAVDRSNVRT